MSGPLHDSLDRSSDGSKRIGELDALRGLAATAVMLFHFTTQYQKEVGHSGGSVPSFSIGDFGVQLFFLISGFVIFMTLERSRSALDFLVSRFSRIYPAYWAAIILTGAIVYSIGLPSHRLPISETALNFTMIQELLRARNLDGSYWTLQVELLFYLQMAFWLWLRCLSRIRWIIVGWLIVALAYYAGGRLGHHFSWTLGELLILAHIPFFAIGILLFQMHKEVSGRSSLYVLLIACLAVIGITRSFVYLLVASICVAIFTAAMSGWLRWLSSRLLAFLGSISYSLYLVHQDIGFAVIWHLERDLDWPSYAGIGSALFATVSIATALTFLVERPSMRWIRSAVQKHRTTKV